MYKKIISLFICFFVLHTFFANTPSLNPNPKKITIYWDSSLSMKDKDLSKEIEFLDNYFNNVKDVVIEFISFSNTIGIDKSFQVSNSDWSSLKDVILGISYDGLAFFENTDRVNGSDINFLFTDGFEVLDKLELRKEIPTYIVNTSKNANHNLLKEKSFDTKGNYIDLTEMSINESLGLLDLESGTIVLNKQSNSPGNKIDRGEETGHIITGEVSGVIYSADGVLSGAVIMVKGGSIGTTTSDSGEFSLKSKLGDILEITYLGMQTKELIVEKLSGNDILMLHKNNDLDEVVIVGTGAVEEAEEKVYTANGKVDSKKLGYTVTTIGEDEFSEAPVTVTDATRGKLLTTTQGQNDDISQAIFRGVNSVLMNQYPLIVIDGSPMERNSSVAGTSTNKMTDYINPDNVASITILRGLAATNRYGSEGNRGVILITTKNAVPGEESKKPYNRALVRDNDYNENLTAINTSIKEKYIDDLKKHTGVKDQYNFYLDQRNKYISDFQYFANVSDYFSQLGYRELSSKILTNILENNSNEIETLLFVAYKAEEKRNFILAERIYKRIIELKPKEAQGYRDLALIYEKTGNYNKALNIYLNIQNNKFNDVNFSGLRKNINNEMRRLILKHKNDLILTGVSNEYFSHVNYDARIVFDYNNRDAEFEFQFVNPQKKFFTWSHTKEMNASRIYDEKNQGFNSEEFLLISAEKGEWLINIESNIKNNKTPVVVKYTVFKNYGKANETQQSKVLLLNNIKGKHTLGKIRI